MQKLLHSLTVFCLLVSSALVNATDFKVLFINPGHPDGDITGSFWSKVSLFMQAASKDLDVELVQIYAMRDHLLMKKLAQKAPDHKPDYVVVVNEKGVGLELLETLTASNIPTFALLNSFPLDDLNRLSSAQRAMFVGSVVPDNYAAGKSQLKALLALHSSQYNRNDNYTLLALRGDHTSPASIARKQGMLAQLSESQNVTLAYSPVANWSRQEAYSIVRGLVNRQRIDLIWSANDAMAFGASKAIAEADLDYQVTIGGVNWDLTQESSALDVSFGGHVTLGAKAVVMLSDFHHRIAAPCEMHQLLNIFKGSQADSIERFNINTSAENIDKFDFTRFSKRHGSVAKFTTDTFVTEKYQALTQNELSNRCQLNTF